MNHQARDAKGRFVPWDRRIARDALGDIEKVRVAFAQRPSAPEPGRLAKALKNYRDRRKVANYYRKVR